jgi:hypothetical protein
VQAVKNDSRAGEICLRTRWGHWPADTPEGEQLWRRWKEWVAGQVRKYEWDVDPKDADHPTILARAEQRYEVDQIANDIGMRARTWSAICDQGSDEGRGRWPEAAPFGQYPDVSK